MQADHLQFGSAAGDGLHDVEAPLIRKCAQPVAHKLPRHRWQNSPAQLNTSLTHLPPSNLSTIHHPQTATPSTQKSLQPI